MSSRFSLWQAIHIMIVRMIPHFLEKSPRFIEENCELQN